MSETEKKVVRRKAKPKEPEVNVDATVTEVPIEEEAEAVVVPKEPEPVEETPVDEPSLDDRLLTYIKELKGNFNIHKACVALNVEDADLIYQAWDRLYDKNLVPYMNIR